MAGRAFAILMDEMETARQTLTKAKANRVLAEDKLKQAKHTLEIAVSERDDILAALRKIDPEMTALLESADWAEQP